MKLLKITTLVLCLNIPMAHAGGDYSSCPDAATILSIETVATCCLAAAAIQEHRSKVQSGQTTRITKTAAVTAAVAGVTAAITLTSAYLAYNGCYSNK
jgi:hypothetical protein